MSSSPLDLDPLVVPLVAGDTVLDVGCGLGKWGALLRNNYYDAGLAAPPSVDGLDAFAPMVAACAASSHYRRVWQQVLPTRLEGRWDTVLAVEVIEHIGQRDVAAVLDQLERAAILRVVITTPNWPAYRPGLATSAGFNQFEAHLSYLSRKQLKARGYQLIGTGLGANPSSRIGRAASRLGLSSGLESLPRLIPRVADQIVAWKDTA